MYFIRTVPVPVPGLVPIPVPVPVPIPVPVPVPITVCYIGSVVIIILTVFNSFQRLFLVSRQPLKSTLIW